MFVFDYVLYVVYGHMYLWFCLGVLFGSRLEIAVKKNQLVVLKP